MPGHRYIPPGVKIRLSVKEKRRVPQISQAESTLPPWRVRKPRPDPVRKKPPRHGTVRKGVTRPGLAETRLNALFETGRCWLGGAAQLSLPVMPCPPSPRIVGASGGCATQSSDTWFAGAGELWKEELGCAVRNCRVACCRMTRTACPARDVAETFRWPKPDPR
jgi:hypothetical protein